MTIDQHCKLCILCRTDNSNSCSVKGTGELSACFCLHGSAVKELIAFHGMDIPVFIVQNTIAKTVHSADIQRLHSDRINMNIAEHIPCKIAAQANTTAVNHTLRCILGQEIAVDKEKYCILCG